MAAFRGQDTALCVDDVIADQFPDASQIAPDVHLLQFRQIIFGKEHAGLLITAARP